MLKAMTRSVLVMVAVAAVVFGVAPEASAVLLSNTNVNSADFGAFAGAAAVPAITSLFDFVPATVGSDGSIDSRVFTGIGAAAGLFVYVYQINHFAGSSEAKIGGASFDWGPVAPALIAALPQGTGEVGVTTVASDSFFIGGSPFVPAGPLPPPPGAPFVAGSVAPTTTDFTGGTITLDHSAAGNILPGASSYVTGFFSPLPPSTVIATMLDGGGPVGSSPSVYSPVPEPGTLLLLGSGLSGLAAWGWRRKKVS